MTDDPYNDHVPLAAAAYELGIPVRTLRRYVEQGRVQRIRFGKLWKIPRTELDRVKRDGIPETERTAT